MTDFKGEANNFVCYINHSQDFTPCIELVVEYYDVDLQRWRVKGAETCNVKDIPNILRDLAKVLETNLQANPVNEKPFDVARELYWKGKR